MKNFTEKLVLVFMILVMLSSCGTRANANLELALCGSYAAPGMFCADLKGGTSQVAVLEEDNYGRIMFSYSAPNVTTQKAETVLVMCQKIDDEYVYFYEDICYTSQYDNHDAIKMIKEQNDWNQPLDHSKMSRRPNQITFDLFIAGNSTLLYGNVIQAAARELGVSSSQLTQLHFVDADNSGNELYWRSCIENSINQSYLLLVSSDYDVCAMKLDDVDISDVIGNFKSENGWKYGS